VRISDRERIELTAALARSAGMPSRHTKPDSLTDFAAEWLRCR
jgi:hypothetical protein